MVSSHIEILYKSLYNIKPLFYNLLFSESNEIKELYTKNRNPYLGDQDPFDLFFNIII